MDCGCITSRVGIFFQFLPFLACAENLGVRSSNNHYTSPQSLSSFQRLWCSAAKCRLLTSLIRGLALWTAGCGGELCTTSSSITSKHSAEEESEGKGDRRSRKLKNKPREATVISEETPLSF